MTTGTIQTSDEIAERMSELAREYADKLNRFKEQAITLASDSGKEKNSAWIRSIRLRDLERYVDMLRPPTEELAREASQLIEHASLNRTSRAELRLRLAELEHSLFSAIHVVAELPR